MINYTWIEGKQTTSCFVRPFRNVKPILVNILFIDLRDMTILCMTLRTLRKRSTTSCARKSNVSKRTSLAKSCLLKPRNSLQWTACSPKVSRFALRQTGYTSLRENNGIIKQYLRILRYSTYDICCLNPSTKIFRRKSRACVACKHPKADLCLVVISNLTSIS